MVGKYRAYAVPLCDMRYKELISPGAFTEDLAREYDKEPESLMACRAIHSQLSSGSQIIALAEITTSESNKHRLIERRNLGHALVERATQAHGLKEHIDMALCDSFSKPVISGPASTSYELPSSSRYMKKLPTLNARVSIGHLLIDNSITKVTAIGSINALVAGKSVKKSRLAPWEEIIDDRNFFTIQTARPPRGTFMLPNSQVDSILFHTSGLRLPENAEAAIENLKNDMPFQDQRAIEVFF